MSVVSFGMNESGLASHAIAFRLLSRSRKTDAYRVRLAATAAEVAAAQCLRFQVFNLELCEGLETSYKTSRDEDPFDSVCDHLLVEEVHSWQVVGTYRLQTGGMASRNLGYYSAQEFELAPFERMRGEVVELGRACVHRSHRNSDVLALLWRGIASYARDRGCRHLIGCSSIPSQDPRVGAAAYLELGSGFLVDASLRTHPLPAFACSLDEVSEDVPRIPPLLRAYLSLGARICGAPALDRAFKTIDFLTCLDMGTLPLSTRQILGG